MKKFLVILMLAGTFLGGYHLGRQPDNPDLFGWLRAAYDEVAALAGAGPGDSAEPAAGGLITSSTGTQMPVTIGGKTYVITVPTPRGAAAAR